MADLEEPVDIGGDRNGKQLNKLIRKSTPTAAGR